MLFFVSSSGGLVGASVCSLPYILHSKVMKAFFEAVMF